MMRMRSGGEGRRTWKSLRMKTRDCAMPSISGLFTAPAALSHASVLGQHTCRKEQAYYETVGLDIDLCIALTTTGELQQVTIGFRVQGLGLE